jgi:hypothetical protein
MFVFPKKRDCFSPASNESPVPSHASNMKGLLPYVTGDPEAEALGLLMQWPLEAISSQVPSIFLF